jgi:hypothetical protein
MTISRQHWIAAAILALAAVLTFFAYRPGLQGGFQLDDGSNLGGLERVSQDPSLEALQQYVLKGIASPLGRPLSLLSFAAQAGDWPDNPRAFLLANVLLHLFNGGLLFWWLALLQRLREPDPAAPLFVPLAATVLWLLAPIQASSVLYVVQRMTELSATFVFLGMGLYLIGRAALARGAQGAGLAWMSLGLAVGAGLGTLAKENSAQMPLMVLALEATLLAGLPRPRAWRAWAVPFLALPSLALLAYVAWIGATGAGFFGRDFTAGERLLTEPRVLFMYVYKLFAAWPSAVRLWYDDFAISRSLFDPWTTALALVALAAATAAAWRARRRWPMPAFAVLWFLACHVLESSALPLELVFEHRNYQAGVGPWLALAAGAHVVLARASSAQARTVLAALAGVYLLLQAAVTWQIATMWGRPLEFAALMAERLPDSRRAALTFVGRLMFDQHALEAAAQAERGARRWPDSPAFPLMTLQLSCQVEQVPAPDAGDLRRRLQADGENSNNTVNNLDSLVSLVEGAHCPVGLPLPLTEITGLALANRAWRPQYQNLLLIHSRALRVEGRQAEARATFRRAVDARPQMILLIQGVIDSVEAGDLAAAREYLERMRHDPRVRPRDRWSHRDDVALLEELIRSQEAATATP